MEATSVQPTEIARKPTRIVICATQRCGSTLLCEDLRNNELGLAEEYFLSLVNKKAQSDILKELDNIQRRGTSDNGIFAVKVMSDYAPRIDSALVSIAEGGANDGLWSELAAYYRDALWIYIERRSILRQAVSRLMARQTGINHILATADTTFVPGKSRVGYDENYNARAGFREQELVEDIADIVAENHLWGRFFADHQIEPLHLFYETIVEGPEYIATIRDRLGLPEAKVRDDRKLMKLSNARSEEIVENFILARTDQRGPAPEHNAGHNRGEAMTTRNSAPPAPPANFPEPQRTNVDGLRETTAVVTRRWASTPYYDAVEGMANSQWTKLIEPFFGRLPIDYSSILELACGHGRMTSILLGKADTVVAVDVLQENIDFCANRFAGVEKLRLVRNDGVTLKEIPDSSITFLFCFDSMVHFDSDVIRAYLGEFRRILKPGGFAFCHHSNYDRNPEGDFQKAPHARNFMTENMFRHYAFKEGLKTVKTKVIDWGAGEKHFERHDCLSLVQKPVA